MPALKPATIGQKLLTDCGQNRPLTTFNNNPNLHNLKVYGIIDRDYRSDYEIEKLKENNIYIRCRGSRKSFSCGGINKTFCRTYGEESGRSI